MTELVFVPEDELMHYGLKGMKRGVRRWQNEDGSFNEEGKKRYGRISGNIGKADAEYNSKNPIKRAIGSVRGHVNAKALNKMQSEVDMKSYRKSLLGDREKSYNRAQAITDAAYKDYDLRKKYYTKEIKREHAGESLSKNDIENLMLQALWDNDRAGDGHQQFYNWLESESKDVPTRYRNAFNQVNSIVKELGDKPFSLDALSERPYIDKSSDFQDQLIKAWEDEEIKYETLKRVGKDKELSKAISGFKKATSKLIRETDKYEEAFAKERGKPWDGDGAELWWALCKKYPEYKEISDQNDRAKSNLIKEIKRAIKSGDYDDLFESIKDYRDDISERGWTRINNGKESALGGIITRAYNVELFTDDFNEAAKLTKSGDIGEIIENAVWQL